MAAKKGIALKSYINSIVIPLFNRANKESHKLAHVTHCAIPIGQTTIDTFITFFFRNGNCAENGSIFEIRDKFLYAWISRTLFLETVH